MVVYCGLMEFYGIYPLVNKDSYLTWPSRNSECSDETWWFSIAYMLYCQRVIDKSTCSAILNSHLSVLEGNIWGFEWWHLHLETCSNKDGRKMALTTWLVVSPLLKNIRMIIPNIWEKKKKCSKPPTSHKSQTWPRSWQPIPSLVGNQQIHGLLLQKRSIFL